MSETDQRRRSQHPPHGSIGYLQLPARDLAQSVAFYRDVFGWSGELEYGSFEAPGLIGQWTLDREPHARRGAGAVDPRRRAVAHPRAGDQRGRVGQAGGTSGCSD